MSGEDLASLLESAVLPSGKEREIKQMPFAKLGFATTKNCK
jgi:hypothetical protein